MKLREPTNGYDFEAKAAYREAVWKAFAENVSDVSTAKVLFFPGREGLEIDVALRHGFKEENLVACDENAALLARAKWRQQYPQIRCYGNELRRVVERMEGDRIVLDAANLDFCSNLCTSALNNIRALLASELMGRQFILAVTMLKGREDTAMVDIAKLVYGEANGTLNRVGVLAGYIQSLLHIPCDVVLSHAYRSTQMMVYGVLRVAPLPSIIQREWATFYQQYDWLYQEVADTLEIIIEESDPNHYDDDPRYKSALARLPGQQHHELRQRLLDKFPIRDKKGTSRVNLPPSPHSVCRVWHAHQHDSEQARRCKALQMEIEDRGYRACMEENARLRNLVVKSAAEKAQLLQAGRSWK